MTAHQFHPSVLREYDIRGLVDETLTEKDAYAIGRAFGTMVKRRGGAKAAVGYDGRESSPRFAKELVKGLRESGINVRLIGQGPSPYLYYAVKSDDTIDAGIMITGSHNPSSYNGFKMLFSDKPVFGELVQDIGRIASDADYESGTGSLEEMDVSEAYLERLVKNLVPHAGFHVIWDNGNGAAGDLLTRLTKKLPGKHEIMYGEVDGTFPNHHPDPTVDENLTDLIAAVKSSGADLGIAFDGDADRIGVVTKTGEILRCDILLALYARTVLEHHPGAAIVADVKCSQVLFNEIDRLGGKPVMWKTGHSLIKTKMAETGAPLAGELSGHIFFADTYYGYDDAMYCAIRLLNVMAETGQDLDALTAHLPRLMSTPEIRFEVDETRKFALVSELQDNLKSDLPQGAEFDDIDGVRISTEDGWWLLRASNTQNVLACRIEAKDEAGLSRLKSMLKTEVQKIGCPVPF